MVMVKRYFCKHTKCVELYTLNEQIVWYVNFISMTLLFKNKKKGPFPGLASFYFTVMIHMLGFLIYINFLNA